MKLFNSARNLALLLTVGALGLSFNANAAKHMAAEGAAKPADAAAKPAKAAKSKKAVKAPEPIKVVYHLNEGNEQASNALRNIGNHLEADPTVKITVVGHSKGIDFMLQGAADKAGTPYAKKVEELALKGVEFRVCNNTLVGRKIDPATVLSDAKIIPAGVSEIARLQSHENHAYVKP